MIGGLIEAGSFVVVALIAYMVVMSTLLVALAVVNPDTTGPVPRFIAASILLFGMPVIDAWAEMYESLSPTTKAWVRRLASTHLNVDELNADESGGCGGVVDE